MDLQKRNRFATNFFGRFKKICVGPNCKTRYRLTFERFKWQDCRLRLAVRANTEVVNHVKDQEMCRLIVFLLMAQALYCNVLPIERIWKFERRSRDYRRMYRDVAKEIVDGIINQKDISY